MKKLFALMLATTMAAGLAACDPPGPPEPDPQLKDIMLYLPDDNAIGFVTVDSATDGSAEHIVSLLVEQNALPAGCAPVSFVFEGARGCVIDMNAAFGRAIGSTGTAGERMLFGSLVNTLLRFHQLEEITVLVEGKPPETGHEIYDYPLRFYQ